MLGGRAAEEVLYGRDTSSFSAQHLPDASWLARKMVSVYVPVTLEVQLNSNVLYITSCDGEQ